ncbi:TPR domain protein, putative component of TonB system [Myxococcus hansupus]|uniref:TPR domain protein, putative component of TonB system n=1 Tax=Pseudomyxococcus hansupus TaxID=1297742 RepID=A0A0H4X7M0_9BACT|nr:tetratricopeptide repeat protein [Myxococcus hansupus]AKQ69933.1 TPR domain protein, putative component of TonB system [Myxococcus hansupus]
MKAAARRLLQQSHAHLEKGEVGRAVHVLKEALGLEPEDLSLWEEMYRLCMLAGSPRSALFASAELRRLAPHSADFAYRHGIAALADGQVEEALAALGDALARAPDSVEVRRALAQVHGALGEPARALALLEEAVALRPTEPDPVNDCAVLLCQQGVEGKRRAVPLLQRVLTAHPQCTPAHLNLALALADTDVAAARAHAQQATRSDDVDVAAQARRLLATLSA